MLVTTAAAINGVADAQHEVRIHQLSHVLQQIPLPLEIKNHPYGMLLNNSCLTSFKLFVIRISASWVMSRCGDHLDVEMRVVENCILYTFETISPDVHRMVKMCVCDVARMDALGMWFHRMVVKCIGCNSGKCDHMVDLRCSKMVGHFLEIVDHVVYVCLHEPQDHVNPIIRRTIDQVAGSKLCDKNDKESWALLEDLTLYDNESWNDPINFVKPVKAISMRHGVPSTSDRHMLELEDQIKYLMIKPKTSSTQPPPYQANVVNSTPFQPSQKNPFLFQRTYPKPRPRKLEPSFENSMYEFMASHTERVERFEEAMIRQKEKLEERVDEMLELVTPKKVLVRDESRQPLAKNVNAIYLCKSEKDEGEKHEQIVDKNMVELNNDVNKPVETGDEPIRKATKESIGEERKMAELPEPQPVSFYLNHKINEKLIGGIIGNPMFSYSLLAMEKGKMECEDYHSLPRKSIRKAIMFKRVTRKIGMEGNFVIPCNVGGTKDMSTLVD
nr:MAK10-like protein [Tanacetum cinerariifolium]